MSAKVDPRPLRPYLVIALDMEDREAHVSALSAGRARMDAARTLVDLCYYETIRDALPRLRVLSMSDRAMAARVRAAKEKEGNEHGS